jgi:hypothetical protein
VASWVTLLVTPCTGEKCIWVHRHATCLLPACRVWFRIAGGGVCSHSCSLPFRLDRSETASSSLARSRVSQFPSRVPLLLDVRDFRKARRLLDPNQAVLPGLRDQLPYRRKPDVDCRLWRAPGPPSTPGTP